MLAQLLLTVGLILGLLLAWIAVQRAYGLFARRHPELGPFRDEDSGCGSCAGGGCGRDGEGGACATERPGRR